MANTYEEFRKKVRASLEYEKSQQKRYQDMVAKEKPDESEAYKRNPWYQRRQMLNDRFLSEQNSVPDGYNSYVEELKKADPNFTGQMFSLEQRAKTGQKEAQAAYDFNKRQGYEYGNGSMDEVARRYGEIVKGFASRKPDVTPESLAPKQTVKPTVSFPGAPITPDQFNTNKGTPQTQDDALDAEYWKREQEQEKGIPASMRLPGDTRRAASAGARDVSYGGGGYDPAKGTSGGLTWRDYAAKATAKTAPVETASDRAYDKFWGPIDLAGRKGQPDKVRDFGKTIEYNIKNYNNPKYALPYMSETEVKAALSQERIAVPAGNKMTKVLDDWYSLNYKEGAVQRQARLSSEIGVLDVSIPTLEQEITTLNTQAMEFAGAGEGDASKVAFTEAQAKQAQYDDALMQSSLLKGEREYFRIQQKDIENAEKWADVLKSSTFDFDKAGYDPQKSVYALLGLPATAEFSYTDLEALAIDKEGNEKQQALSAIAYEYINARGNIGESIDSHGWETLSEDEKLIFNTLHNEGSYDEALTFLDDYKELFLFRRQAGNVKEWEAYAKENHVWAWLMAGGQYLVNAVMTPFQLMSDSPYSPSFDVGVASQTIQATQSKIAGERLGASVLGKPLGSLVYDLITSMRDNGVSIGLGGLVGSRGLTLFAMSSNATSSSYRAALMDGTDRGTAAILSIGAGAIEWLTEKYSLEALMSNPKSALKYFFKNVIAEGSEEGASAFANLIMDNYLRGNSSEFFKSWKKIKEENPGKTNKQITEMANAQWRQELGTQVAMGAAAGGILGGPVTITTAIASRGEKVDSSINDAYSGIMDDAGMGVKPGEAEYLDYVDRLNQAYGMKPEAIDDTPSPEYSQNKRAQLQTELDKQPTVEQAEPEQEVEKPTMTQGQRLAELKSQMDAIIANKDNMTPEEITKAMEEIAPEIEAVSALPIEAPVTRTEGETRAEATMIEPQEQAPVLPEKGPLQAPVTDRKTMLESEGIVPGAVEQTGKEEATTGRKVLTVGDKKVAYKTVTSGNEVAAQHKANNPDLDEESYSLAFETAYAAGMTGTESALNNSDAVKALAPDTIKAAFDAGKGAADFEADKARAAKVLKMLRPGNGTVRVLPDVKTLDTEQKALTKHISQFARLLGINAEIFASETDAEGKYIQEQGSFNPETGLFRFDINAGLQNAKEKMNAAGAAASYTLPKVMGHEFSHFLKATNPELFRTFEDAVFKTLALQGQSVDDLIQQKLGRARKGALSIADAMEEVVADGSEMMLLNSDVFKGIMTGNKTLFEKFKSWVSDFVKGIQDRLKRMQPSFAEAKALMELKNGALQYVGDLQAQWDTMMRNALTPAEGAQSDAATGKAETLTPKRNAQDALKQGKNDGTKFAERDNQYLAAVENGDTAEQQRLVEEAAKAAGYNETGVHGLAGGVLEGNRFNPEKRGLNTKAPSAYLGFYFASEETANRYAKKSVNLEKAKKYSVKLAEIFSPLLEKVPKGVSRNLDMLRRDGSAFFYAEKDIPYPSLYEVASEVRADSITDEVLKALPKNDDVFNIVDDITQKLYDAFGASGFSDTIDASVVNAKLKMQNPYVYDNENSEIRTDAFYKIVMRGLSGGYDSVLIKNVQDGGPMDDIKIVFSPDQIKSADPVTYDDSGKPIPLSQRFNPATNDIRYSERDPENSLPSPRAILAGAFGQVAQTDAEKKNVEKYRKSADMYNRVEGELNALLEKRRQLYINKAPQTEKNEVRADIIALKDKLDKADRILFNLEMSGPLRSVVEREREKVYKAQLEKGQERQAAYRAKIKGSDRRGKLIGRTEDIANELRKWLMTPDKKHHIPEALRRTVSGLLEALDMSWTKTDGTEVTSKRSKSWQEAMGQLLIQMQNADAFAVNNGEIASPDFVMNIDPDLAPMIQDLITRNDSVVRYRDMNPDELAALDKIMRMVHTAVTTANKMIDMDNAETVAEVADGTLADLAGKKDKKLHGPAIERLSSFLNLDMMDSFSFFEQLGEKSKAILSSLYKKGFGKLVRNTVQARDFFLELDKKYKDFGIANWSGKNAEVRSFDLERGKVHLTTGQMMELYLLNKRDQARGHIYGKGISIEQIKSRKAGKEAQLWQKDPVGVNEAEVMRITDTLTAQQKAAADEIATFLNTVSSEWGNEVSMALYGYLKFVDPNYYPIHSDTNFTLAQDPSKNEMINAIINQGMTKNVIKGANNPIIISDIFDTVSRHVTDMANYNAFAVPLTNAMKWFNYNREVVDASGNTHNDSVKGSIERTLGKDAKSYFINLLKAVNGIKGTNAATGFIGMVNSMVGKFKTAAVAGNIRVVLQQHASYTRAASMINPAYMAAAYTKSPKRGMQMARKYAPIAMWKHLGYYDMQIGREMVDLVGGRDNPLRKAQELALKPAGIADDFTMGVLWNAVELEVGQNYRGDKRGEDFFKAVGDRLIDVIDRTQVVDTVFHRPQIMRDRDSLVKISTSFMAEPIKSYNLLVNAAKSGDKGRLARTGVTFVATSILVAMAAGLADALRDKEKEKGWEGFWKSYWNKVAGVGGNFFESNIFDNTNPLNMIPFGKDIWGIAGGYAPSRPDLQAVQRLIWAAQGWLKVFNGTDAKVSTKLITNTITALSTATGIPVANIYRDVMSVIDTLDPRIVVGDGGTPASLIYERYVDALMAGEADKALEYYDAIIKSGIDSKKAYGGTRDEIKELYKAEEIAFGKAVEILDTREGKPEGGAYWTVKEWEARKAAGDWSQEFKYSRYDKYRAAILTGANLKALMQELLDHYGGKDPKDAKGSVSGDGITDYFKDIYIETYKRSRSEAATLKSRLLNAYVLLGYKRDDRSRAIDAWLKK
ncbi:MAG: hypothetical protein WC356_03365 [Candidatus Micrarchaeia archaeon]|jgi:hypothetical protein